MSQWEATRAAALARAEAFAPKMGRAYAARRNYDIGLDADTVSALSPWVRRRLISERELLEMAIAGHGADAAKFVSEVLWRGYFKGWLEQRPEIWDRYVAGLGAARASVAQDAALAERLAAAVEGRTGIDCFDAWIVELRAQGWLHNHARMWFASIWIFTLAAAVAAGGGAVPARAGRWRCGVEHAVVALGRGAAYARETLSGAGGEYPPLYRRAVRSEGTG